MERWDELNNDWTCDGARKHDTVVVNTAAIRSDLVEIVGGAMLITKTPAIRFSPGPEIVAACCSVNASESMGQSE